jgi:primosomal protein N' (replication factor Y)
VEITTHFKKKNVVLLHGVTSSGKTEIYIHLIEDALKSGKQVLYLLPEIALTSQLTDRLKRVFGNKLGIYHSKFPDAERVEIWNNLLLDKGYEIILGVRSSVFLPFKNLGWVIVDEEHENTYKNMTRSTLPCTQCGYCACCHAWRKSLVGYSYSFYRELQQCTYRKIWVGGAF